MEQLERRKFLTVTENPDIRSDYVVSMGGEFSGSKQPISARIEMRYVPDRDILNQSAFHSYLNALSQEDWKNLEEIATTILGDLSNQLVPRWIQISIVQNTDTGDQRHSHSVLLEDRQPTWDNPSLVSRLKLR